MLPMASEDSQSASPLSPGKVVDLYFLDARIKLIEIAAFLDRVERACEVWRDTPEAMSEDDYRLAGLKEALRAVAGDGSQKAKTVQTILSDPTEEPLESAAGMKGASGAYNSKTSA